MNLKRITVLALIIAMLTVLVGCSGALTPKDAINTLFSGLKKYDIEKMAKVLSEFPNADDCSVTYDPFSDTPYVLLYQKAYPDLKFTVVSIDQTSDTNATAIVKVTHPDLKTAYTTALYSSMAMIFSNEDLFNSVIENEDAEISYYVPNQMQNMVTNEQVETIETEYTLQLVKEDKGWLIVTDEQLKNLVSSNLYKIASGTENIFSQEETE